MRARTVVLLFACGVAAVASGGTPAGHLPKAAAQATPQCDDGIDNDGDGLTDWLEDPDCDLNPDTIREGPPTACGDHVDNDGDGKVDVADPGCRGNTNAAAETDPAPQRSSTEITVAKPDGCGIETGVEVLPDLTPKALFPFADVSVRVRGAEARTRSIDVTRSLPLAPDRGYGFDGLRRGRYEVTATYPGDRFRLASAAQTRHVSLSTARCRLYVTDTGSRKYKPSRIVFGANANVFGLHWQRWGGPTAVGTGTFPFNSCVPFCAAGHITNLPVTVHLTRRRLCNRYQQYLTMRVTFRGARPPGGARGFTTRFGYRCQ